MASLAALGYTPEDEEMLQPSVKDMILKRRLKKPRTGIPSDWMRPDVHGPPPPQKSGTSLLQDALRVNEETVEIGTTVVNQLHTQTGQLRNADNTALEIQDEAAKGREILRQMRYRLWREKAIASAVIVAVLAVDCFLAYELATC